MMLAGAGGQQEGRYQQNHTLHGEKIDQAHDPALREHRERKQQQECRTQIEQLQIQRNAGHCLTLPATGGREDPAPPGERRRRETPGRGRSAASPTRFR